MIALLSHLGAWNWFIAAALLLILELLAPGVYMLWLGLAALVVGLGSLVVDWSWQSQGAAFVVIAAALFPLWWRFGRRLRSPTDQPFLNRRAQAFVGRVFTLDKPIIDGAGTIGIDDTIWRVTGPDCPAGSRVTVTRADGPTLCVERSTG
jgi:membrane protein implicated in regulation of membrane protease activity